MEKTNSAGNHGNVKPKDESLKYAGNYDELT